MKLLTYLTAILSLTLGIAHAQSEPPIYNLQLQFVSLDAPYTNLHLVQEGNLQLIRVGNRAASRPYNYRGTLPIRLAILIPSPVDPSLPPIPKEVTNFSPNVGLGNKFIIGLQRTQAGENLSFRAMSIPAERDVFPERSYLFFNTTDRLLAGKLSDQQFEMPPAKPTMMQLDKQDSQSFRVNFVGYSDGEWTQAYSKAWPYQESYRYLVFVFDSTTYKGSLTFKMIADRMEEQPVVTGGAIEGSDGSEYKENTENRPDPRQDRSRNNSYGQ